jgi:hypothetical protein
MLSNTFRYGFLSGAGLILGMTIVISLLTRARSRNGVI